MRTYVILSLLNAVMFLINTTILMGALSGPNPPVADMLIGMVAGSCAVNFVVAVALIFGFGYFKRTWK